MLIRQALPEHSNILIDFWLKLDQSQPSSSISGFTAERAHFHQQLAEQLTSQTTAIALIAWQKQTAVASICGHLHQNPQLTHSPLGIIYNLWVEPNQRRKGIAQSLVQQVEEVLQQQGAKSLQVAWRQDKTAEQFWQKLGYLAVETIAAKST